MSESIPERPPGSEPQDASASEVANRGFWWRQGQLLIIAIGFFTRLPMPASPLVAAGGLQQASRYYGVVGWLVGALVAVVYWLAGLIWPVEVAVLLSMAAGLLLTGGFHEDGLADTWDGFGGGWTPAKKLEIMKDSRLGTYGALSLVVALLLKYQLLVALAATPQSPAGGWVVVALLLGHSLSRATAVSLIFDQPYVRDTDSSKVKPMTQEQTAGELAVLLVSAALPLWLVPGALAGWLAAVLVLLRGVLVRWYRRQLGGYTGDTLGAAQQLLEIACYLVILGWAGSQ